MEGYGEPVSLIANELNQVQYGRVVIERDRIFFLTVHIENFFALSDGRQRLVDDLERIQRWAGLLAGRGACRHPDGAAGLLGSALRVFAEEFERHAFERRCSVARAVAVAS